MVALNYNLKSTLKFLLGRNMTTKARLLSLDPYSLNDEAGHFLKAARLCGSKDCRRVLKDELITILELASKTIKIAVGEPTKLG